MGTVKHINIKNRTNRIIFTMALSILKILNQTCYQLTENPSKRSVFTTLDILQLKKLMIAKILTVWIHCIYVLPVQTDILKKNLWLYRWKQRAIKNIIMLGMESKTKSKQ